MLNHQHRDAVRGRELLEALEGPAISEMLDVNLDSCALDRVPDALPLHEGLETLSLYDNRLTTLPDRVWRLSGLKTSICHKGRMLVVV